LFGFTVWEPSETSSQGLILQGQEKTDVRQGAKFTMDKKKLEAFKKRLETRQQELRRTVNRTQADGRTVDEDTAQDIADRAASSYNKEFLFSQSNNERQLLQMVEKALTRIREGSFGECAHCGSEINAKRLEAVPWTRHCIECQEKLEQGLLEEAPR
jgi:DnaK suppressor protein